MAGRTTTNLPDYPSKQSFQGVNPLSISISQKNRNRQSSNIQSIDDIKTPTFPRRSSTFPQQQERAGGILPSNPQVASAATATSLHLSNYGNHVTFVIQDPNSSRSAEDVEHIEAQTGQGNTTTSQPQNAQHHKVADSLPHIPEDFSKRGVVRMFATETLPRLIYLHLLLRLPYLYFSRVDRIFWGADLSMEEIKEMALQDLSADIVTIQRQVEHCFLVEGAGEPPAYLRLKTRWGELIDTLMEEWKTLNIISVLLLSAIMAMFQIHGAAQDPIPRYLAFCSLICALMSLLHGCMFIVRFSPMRKGYRAAEWAFEAQKHLNPFWNVWVMLSMPLVWLTWSIITFIICIMTFMWRSRAALPEDFIFFVSPATEIAARVFISIVLGTGALYTLLIVNTLRRYGTRMDVAWRKRINDYIEESLTGKQSTTPAAPGHTPSARPEDTLPIQSPTEISVRANSGEPAATLGVVIEHSVGGGRSTGTSSALTT